MTLSALQLCSLIAVCILTAATLGTTLLIRRAPGNATLLKVRTIVGSWWIIVGCFLGALAAGRWGVLGLCYLTGLFGLREYIRHSRISFKNYLLLVVGSAMTLLFVSVGMGWERMFLGYPGLVFPVVVPLVVISANAVAQLPMIMASTMGLMLFTYFMAHIPALVHLHAEVWTAPEQELLAVAMLFLMTEANDVFQFISGKLFGRRKPFPQISPNKTEAGFLGGLVLTPLLAAATLVPFVGLTAGQALVTGVAVFFVGVLGDLTFSMIKRHFGTKDFSNALPGHGGILDRVDSLVLTAPIYYHLILFFKGHIP